MNYSEFIGKVQHRAKLPTEDDAVKATRATLETLSERLAGKEPGNLASQLPEEIGRFMKAEGGQEGFALNEFFERIAKKQSIETNDASTHAYAVMDAVREAVTEGELDDVKQQLPDEFHPLFDESKR